MALLYLSMEGFKSLMIESTCAGRPRRIPEQV